MKHEERALIISQAVIGTGIILTVLTKALPLALSAFLIHEAARGMFRPIKDAYLNDHIPSKERATIISFDSMAKHLGGIVGLFVSGFLAEYVSMDLTWVMLDGVLLGAALFGARKVQPEA